MSRYFVTFALLGAVILWLVLSYAGVALPTIAFSNALVLNGLPILGLAVLGVFVLLQLDLVRATVRMLRQPSDATARGAVEMFGLHTGREVLWTALPLAGTVVLMLLLIRA